MRVSFSEAATDDLRSIGYYIAADNPGRARTFVAELRSACRSLSDRPERYIAVKSSPKGMIRRLTHQAYVAFYQVRENEVFVIRIVHGARVTDDFLDELR